MSGTCRKRSSSPASVTSPTPGCTAAYTSCHPLGTGEAAGPAGGGPAAQGREEEESPAWAVGWHPLTRSLLPSPPSLPYRLSSLRPLDIEFLQRLCRTVNVVPVIARADSLTIEERETFRRRVIWAPRVMGSVGAKRRQSAQDEMRSPASPDPAQPEDSLH